MPRPKERLNTWRIFPDLRGALKIEKIERENKTREGERPRRTGSGNQERITIRCPSNIGGRVSDLDKPIPNGRWAEVASEKVGREEKSQQQAGKNA